MRFQNRQIPVSSFPSEPKRPDPTGLIVDAADRQQPADAQGGGGVGVATSLLHQSKPDRSQAGLAVGPPDPGDYLLR